MSARRSPPGTNPCLSPRRSPQCIIRAAGGEAGKSGAHAGEGRFQPAADGRFSMVDGGSAHSNSGGSAGCLSRSEKGTPAFRTALPGLKPRATLAVPLHDVLEKKEVSRLW